MNRGFFSALVGLMVLSVALAIALGSPAYNQNRDLPLESSIATNKAYLWIALDRSVNGYLTDWAESYASCPSSLTADEIDDLEIILQNRLDALEGAWGMNCTLDGSIPTIESGEFFRVNYQCERSGVLFFDQVLQEYDFTTVTDPDGGPPSCTVIDQLRD